MSFNVKINLLCIYYNNMDEANIKTKKAVITIKYNNLIKKLKELDFLKKIPFPSLEDVDISEVIFYLKILLIDKDNEYRQNLKTLLLMKKIVIDNDEDFEKFHCIVYPFINFIMAFL